MASRGGVGQSGRAELQVHVYGEAPREGNKNRQNRFPGLGSRSPYAKALGLTKRGRDTPRARAPTLTRRVRGTDAWREEALWTRIP